MVLFILTIFLFALCFAFHTLLCRFYAYRVRSIIHSFHDPDDIPDVNATEPSPITPPLTFELGQNDYGFSAGFGATTHYPKFMRGVEWERYWHQHLEKTHAAEQKAQEKAKRNRAARERAEMRRKKREARETRGNLMAMEQNQQEMFEGAGRDTGGRGLETAGKKEKKGQHIPQREVDEWMWCN